MDRADNRKRGRCDADLDTFNGFVPPVSGHGTTTDHFVVWGLPCNQSKFCRGKKAGCHLVEGSRSNINGSRKEIFDHDHGIVDVTGAIVPYDNEKLSFRKNEFLWRVAESPEAFSKMPQKPHFFPVESLSPSLREGKALGLMVIFDNIAKKISNLRSIAPQVIKDDLQLLQELEENGFDVEILRNRLTKMLMWKDWEKELGNVSKESAKRLSIRQHEKCKVKEKHAKILEKIMELRKEAELLALSMERIDAEFASDQLAGKEIADELNDYRIAMEALDASPLF